MTSTTSRLTTPSPLFVATPLQDSRNSATRSPISPTKSQAKNAPPQFRGRRQPARSRRRNPRLTAPPSLFKLCNPCGTARIGCALTSEPHLTNSIPRRTSFTFRGSVLRADSQVFSYVPVLQILTSETRGRPCPFGEPHIFLEEAS